MEEKLGILGGGKMAEALLSGLLRSGWRAPTDVIVTVRREERAKYLSEKYGVMVGFDNPKAVANASILILAVKPQDMGVLLEQITGSVHRDQLVISFAAGITTSFIEARITADAPVVRVMSNVPAIVDEAMTVISPGSRADEKHLAIAEEIWLHVGRVVRLAEKHLDAITATSGSGPAYFALLAEAMIDACILLGLSRDVATELIVQTMLGSAKMLRETKMHPVELRELVTSPGGTTINAIRELENAGVRAAFLNAIHAAAARARELAAGVE
ncbi:MAG: pyrroline-5-carboxylate reductase [Actinomycetota bacterium]|nr:pyrroline-5-carboxylate reductase [Actinomycetota bacterium]